MVLLDNDGFLTELSKLYAKTKISGSIWLTMKRYEHQMVSEGEGKGSSSVKKQKNRFARKRTTLFAEGNRRENENQYIPSIERCRTLSIGNSKHFENPNGLSEKEREEKEKETT